MRDEVAVSRRKGRNKTVGVRTRGGWEQLGCSGPSVEDLSVVYWVGVGIAQPERRQDSPSNRRADSLMELQEPEPRQRVGSVVGQSECCQQVFYVGGLDEPQTPIFDIRNSPTPELELQEI